VLFRSFCFQNNASSVNPLGISEYHDQIVYFIAFWIVIEELKCRRVGSAIVDMSSSST